MKEYISLSLPGIDVDCFIMQAPEVLVHPYVSCSILLINTGGILWVLWNLVSSWYKRRQVSGEAILKCALKRPVPGWQGGWKDLGRFLGRLSPPIIWDFTPEQASNPGKLTRHLIEGCLAYPNENQQLLALYWGLAYAYRAIVQHSQRTTVEAGTQTASEDTMLEIGTQTTTRTTVIAPIVKKKQWTRRSTGPYHRLVREEEEEERLNLEAGPSIKKLEEGVRELKQEAEEVFEKGKRIIQILLKAGFAIKKSKVKGPAQEIQFLGIKWQDGRHHVPMDVVNKIATMSPPANKKETQAFLGLVGFWRMHIPGYSQLVSPLYRVTRKKNYFEWGPEQQQAFEHIRQEIAREVALGPVRTGPDVQNVLYTAAGEHGLNWSLWQKTPGETRGRPLGFWSRGYRGSEAHYTPTEKEILAAYEGVRAASEVVGTEAYLLLAPRLPMLHWMFKGNIPSPHHIEEEERGFGASFMKPKKAKKQHQKEIHTAQNGTQYSSCKLSLELENQLGTSPSVINILQPKPKRYLHLHNPRIINWPQL
ncbi:uncharacterized protein ACIBXB_005765 [Morphnus guianensis]